MPPVRDNACNIPMEAAELWMIPVNTVPMSKPRNGLLKRLRKLEKSVDSANGDTESLISFMPYIRTAKPTKTDPISLSRFFFVNMNITIPKKAITREKYSGFNILTKVFSELMPISDSTHAVSVVPMFEPKSTPIVCESSISPEFTRPTSITVVADEDCMAIVIPAPRTRHFTGFDVIALSVFSSRPPAILSRPDDMTCIPYRKKVSPPKRVINEKISIFPPIHFWTSCPKVKKGGYKISLITAISLCVFASDLNFVQILP